VQLTWRLHGQKCLVYDIILSANAAAIFVPKLWSYTSAYDPKRPFAITDFSYVSAERETGKLNTFKQGRLGKQQ
jgi:hypothetical protein